MFAWSLGRIKRPDRLSQRWLERVATPMAALLPFSGRNRAFLAVARKIFAQAGALSFHLEATVALRRVADSPDLEREERVLRGRLRETDPTWLPYLPKETSVSPSNPRRVLHLLKASAPYRQSGYTMRSEYLINGQRRAGLDPVVMTALGFPRSLGHSDVADVEFLNGTPYHRLDSGDLDIEEWAPDIYLEVYAQHAASRLSRLAASLVHVHSGHRGFEAALVGLALAQSFDLPLVYEVRGFFESSWSRDPSTSERAELYLRRYATETRCMREADVVVTLSESMRRDIVGRGILESKVFVVPNGVDTDRFCPAPRREQLIRALDLAGKFVFGYVSNLDHWREGHETLIQAATLLRKRGLPTVALIVGDGKRRAELEAMLTRENKDSVVFTGQLPHDEVMEYYRLLDIFVVPRLADRAASLVTPLKPLEAMALGVPVVVADLPALREIIGDGERGRVFRSGDAESLAATLTDLWKKPELRANLASEARQWVCRERRWSLITERYGDVYEAAVASHRTNRTG